jgi:lysophospholipase L1-like esterase
MKFGTCFLVIVLLCSCQKKNAVIPNGTNQMDISQELPVLPGDSVRYLALGDSYTYGDGVSLQGSFPYQLSDTLGRQGYLVSVPTEVALFGWTSGDLLSSLNASKITQKFDFVTLLIGANDEAHGISTTTFTANLDILIATAIQYTNGDKSRVFVLSIPDWSVTPFAANMDKPAIAAGVDLFNTINQVEAEKFGANYIDLTALSEMAATDPSLTSADGLHPSAKMYALWVKQFSGQIIASFNK